jgi:hypothetical protein
MRVLLNAVPAVAAKVALAKVLLLTCFIAFVLSWKVVIASQAVSLLQRQSGANATSNKIVKGVFRVALAMTVVVDDWLIELVKCRAGWRSAGLT